MRPSGEAFPCPATGAGIDELIARLKAHKPIAHLIAVSRRQAASKPSLLRDWLGRVCPSPSSILRRSGLSPRRSANAPRPTQSMRRHRPFRRSDQAGATPLPDQATQLLADLVSRRRQIVDMIASKSQRERRANPRIMKSIARVMKALERELKGSTPVAWVRFPERRVRGSLPVDSRRAR